MQEFITTYSDLRKATERLKNLMRCTVSFNEELSYKTALYQDLGVIGLDWDVFLEEYKKAFDCSLTNLKYEDYFVEVDLTKTDLYLLPFRLLLFPMIMLQLPVSKKLNKALFPVDKTKKRLTVGDLVLSSIGKTFIKREEVKIVIKKASH